jgi:hypothetical protein
MIAFAAPMTHDALLMRIIRIQRLLEEQLSALGEWGCRLTLHADLYGLVLDCMGVPDDNVEELVDRYEAEGLDEDKAIEKAFDDPQCYCRDPLVDILKEAQEPENYSEALVKIRAILDEEGEE